MALTPQELLLELKSFDKERAFMPESFIEGIHLFCQIANYSPQDKARRYGNEFLGLHYSSDLAQLFNDSGDLSIEAYQLQAICPPQWEYVCVDGFLALIYRGKLAGAALDSLLRGPTVIDCGMFCQLAIWFGLKYMLGNDTFDKVFAKAPLYLTQVVYNPIASINSAAKGNPLHPFFDEVSSSDSGGNEALFITHIHNHHLYHQKHPGGAYGGNNCVLIANRYTVFDPTLESTNDLSKEEVETLLLSAFNQDQGEQDKKMLAHYEQHRELSHPILHKTYGELCDKAKDLEHFKADRIVLSNRSTSPKIAFNFHRFKQWYTELDSLSLAQTGIEPLVFKGFNDYQLKKNYQCPAFPGYFSDAYKQNNAVAVKEEKEERLQAEEETGNDKNILRSKKRGEPSHAQPSALSFNRRDSKEGFFKNKQRRLNAKAKTEQDKAFTSLAR
jgi:hypothetical protein